jgi:hypothetical protein
VTARRKQSGNASRTDCDGGLTTGIGAASNGLIGVEGAVLSAGAATFFVKKAGRNYATRSDLEEVEESAKWRKRVILARYIVKIDSIKGRSLAVEHSRHRHCARGQGREGSHMCRVSKIGKWRASEDSNKSDILILGQ